MIMIDYIYHVNVFGRFWTFNGTQVYNTRKGALNAVRGLLNNSMNYLMMNNKTGDYHGLLVDGIIITRVDVKRCKAALHLFKSNGFSVNKTYGQRVNNHYRNIITISKKTA